MNPLSSPVSLTVGIFFVAIQANPPRPLPSSRPVKRGITFRWAVGRVFFSSPRGKKRENLTLWESLDETRTWRPFKLVQDGPSGCADLVKTADGKLGVLHEH